MYKSKDFVELRNWILEDDSVVSVEEIKRLFEELISAANISAYVGDITIDGKLPAIAIYSITNDRYDVSAWVEQEVLLGQESELQQELQ